MSPDIEADFQRELAEIAARMMVQDYPSSATARDCLARVMEMGGA
ncbi:hypothetical protein [Limnohabitans sp. Rim28]|nr:hypothetical protein [Limnohabitans sp. Rim28]